ncbi:AraC family transcriptional regulator [Zunongwangia pacifica]|uniref:AraC family transcriptional regulator n=1 Tax=Zunongwangia pacifica TaxID=2911062 RepID=A0A9X1ZR56_9FLAO|nr:AraC family transcriptional regulator [Zunongwangia pacifica]MCL6219507.1 AraC family transcriptional regulator [Zunongwangia pacifica]
MQTPKILSIPKFKEDLNKKDFYFNDFRQHLEKNKELILSPHGHDFYLCVVFTAGKGTHEIDFKSYEIRPGSIFFMRPGQIHSWKFTMPPEGYIFFHSKNLFNLLLPNDQINDYPFYISYHNPPNLLLNKKELASTIDQLQFLKDEYNSDKYFSFRKIAYIISIIYIDLSRYYLSKYTSLDNSNSRYFNIIYKLEAEIAENYRSNKSVDFYADRLHLSKRHLDRITHQILGKSVKAIISEYVVLKAKAAILQNDLSLLYLSEDLGFKSLSHFSKFFKNHVGVSPNRFKEGYRL